MLAAGLVVLGLALAVLEVVSPTMIGGTGLMRAAGPRLDRVLVQLVVGVLGECLHHWRSRLPDRIRPAMAAALIALSFAALWWGWWR